MHEMTVGHYLLRRLEEAGLEHMFGVPGDYVLDFMDQVVESRIRLIGNCNELNAGSAALERLCTALRQLHIAKDN